jgi:flagellar biosynthesis regulator FlaF
MFYDAEPVTVQSRKSNGYAPQRGGPMTVQEVQLEVFERACRALSRAKAAGPGDLDLWHRALVDNHTLWTHIASEALSDSSPLPLKMRANFVNMAQSVIRQTPFVMMGTGDIERLITINLLIRDGLRASIKHAHPKVAAASFDMYA